MAWTIELHEDAFDQLARLARKDRVTARRITRVLAELAELDDPRVRAKALSGPLAGLWRYRVGDWRVIADIQEHRLVILALDIEHRSTVYRRR
ncbi:MAG: type II toxin-antitoxin system RelE/ParE family toxin [Propionibacterium sp.]|nr:type II toxin-antitoxin system RelE/ParE family toxin [Propionibacterium sp.]